MNTPNSNAGPKELDPGVMDAPGILIQDGGLGTRTDLRGPRLAAFVYGERLPASPTLPFGRWKQGA